MSKPFTFSSYGKPKEKPTKSKLVSDFIESQYQQFIATTSTWKQTHELGITHLSDYGSAASLLPTIEESNADTKINYRSISIVTKCTTQTSEETHKNLVEVVEKHYDLLTQMKKTITKCKQHMNSQIDSNHQYIASSDKGPYNTLINTFDRIEMMQNYINMFEQEFDIKSTIVNSLNEQEKSYVLNTYLITWRKQPFYDSNIIKRMSMQNNIHDRTKNLC
ncbi:hypothetical protein AKO1_007532 [Acrasis kona]|uniref:Uncharacterized protein n=1 Tax=Acrasis kona TaxID=1008807 RepID=A0AAW2Z7P2_9EUKA